MSMTGLPCLCDVWLCKAIYCNVGIEVCLEYRLEEGHAFLSQKKTLPIKTVVLRVDVDH